MGGAVIDAQGARTPTDINTKSFPRKRLLKNTLAEIASKEKCVGTRAANCGKEPKVGDTDILRLVNDRKIKNHLLGLGYRGRQRCEQLRICNQLASLQVRSHKLEDGPQYLSLSFWEPRFPPKAGDIPIS